MNDAVFRECLSVSVYLWIDLLAETTFEQRQARAHRCAQIVGAHGDAILYLVPTKKPMTVERITDDWERNGLPDDDSNRIRRNVSTADAFNALAEGLACAAFQPGGIKAFGLHFEAHERPRSRTAQPEADHGRRRAAEEFWGPHTCPAACALCASMAAQAHHQYDGTA